jgi:hypothetical protein
MAEATVEPASLHLLPLRLGAYTERLLSGYSAPKPLSSKEALADLTAEMTPFCDRLSDYLSERFSINNETKAIRKQLSVASDVKGLGVSSTNLSQWIPSRSATLSNFEVYISPQSVFKLCLAMELDIEDSAHFVYDCLYQNWFNYRNAEEIIYFFFLAAQDLFGNDTYNQAKSVHNWYKDLQSQQSQTDVNNADKTDQQSRQDFTGVTRFLGNGVKQLLESPYENSSQAKQALRDYLEENRTLFTNVQKSGVKTYREYFGGIPGSTIVPLTELYKNETGRTLPTTYYLEMTYLKGYKDSKCLLWGTENRSEWLKADNDNKDFDILREEEIKIERHAVERMLHNGVPRGNMIALLFFHFCFKNKDLLKKEEEREGLFNRFYDSTNLTLVDSCGMMPLHPRKPFDRLFMLSIAKSGRDPLGYLNTMLEELYRSGF